MVQSLVCGQQLIQRKRPCTLKPRGADEVAFASFDVSQVPGTVRQGESCTAIAQPKCLLREI